MKFEMHITQFWRLKLTFHLVWQSSSTKCNPAQRRNDKIIKWSIKQDVSSAAGFVVQDKHGQPIVAGARKLDFVSVLVADATPLWLFVKI